MIIYSHGVIPLYDGQVAAVALDYPIEKVKFKSRASFFLMTNLILNTF